jgi:RimJ/RimL family protein N-acetyltransferase
LLSLKEEYENQRSWREDSEKLTFIVCLNDTYSQRLDDTSPYLNTEENRDNAVIGGIDDRPSSMIGDINLFIHNSTPVSSPDGAIYLTGEINLMIARQQFRRQGIGPEVLTSFVSYVLEYSEDILREFKGDKRQEYRLVSFQAKIDHQNKNSIKLFERFGFTLTRDEPNYFGELDFVLDVNRARDKIQSLKSTLNLDFTNYNEV